MTFFEELSLNAHPAIRTLFYDGWILRFSNGYTNRANSVNMIYPSTLPPEEKVRRCEEIYAANGLPAVFKITPVSDPALDDILEKRGYAIVTPTDIMTMKLCNLPDDFIRSDVAEGLTKEWQNEYLTLSGLDNDGKADSVRAIQGGILNRRFCTSTGESGAKSACGMCVIERGYVGLYDIFVKREFRQKGLGYSVCVSLLDKARSAGVKNAYIQVVAANTPAVNLYTKIGYRFLYRYHYRVQSKAK